MVVEASCFSDGSTVLLINIVCGGGQRNGDRK